jgi:hypothetical protein
MACYRAPVLSSTNSLDITSGIVLGHLRYLDAAVQSQVAGLHYLVARFLYFAGPVLRSRLQELLGLYCGVYDRCHHGLLPSPSAFFYE